MEDPIPQRLNRAAECIHQSCVEITTRGEIPADTFEILYNEDALGGLFPSRVNARTVINTLMKRPDFHVNLLENLKEFAPTMNTDDRDEAFMRWWNVLLVAIDEASAPETIVSNSDLDGMNEQKQNNPESDEAPLFRQKVTTTIKIPTYDGTFGKCGEHFERFISAMEDLHAPKKEYFSILRTHVTGDAYKFVNKQKVVIGKDFSKMAEAMIIFFDDVSPDELKRVFTNQFRQQNNEPIKAFYLRLSNAIYRLIAVKKMTSYTDDPEQYEENMQSSFISR